MEYLLRHSASGPGRTPRRAAVTLALLLLGMLAAGPLRAQSIIYVDIDATGANDGTSWADAFVYLQDALAVAQDGDEVWVAEGVYRPDQGSGIWPGDREVSFEMRFGVRIYGGFSADEQNSDVRDPSQHESVLSGDLLDNDVGELDPEEPSRADNSLHVVRAEASSSETLLDGFTVTGGNGYAESSEFGGGIFMRSPAAFRNLVIRGNQSPYGGGMWIWNVPDGGAVLEDILFENNRAMPRSGVGRGGGLAIKGSGSQRFERLSFFGNEGTLGGGLLNETDNLQCIDCTFVGNWSTEGGGIFTEHPYGLLLINGVFLGNYGTGGGAIAAHRSIRTPRDVIIVNTLIAGNSSLVGGGIDAGSMPVQIINSTIAYNTATRYGGGMQYRLNTGDTLRISNSIVWGNSADTDGNQLYVYEGDSDGGGIVLENSLLEGAIPGYVTDDGATISAAPLFADPDGFDNVLGTLDDDLQLLVGSPAVDAGNRMLLPPDSLDLDRDGRLEEPLPIDLLYHSRVHDGGTGTDAVDLGPYEFGSPAVGLASLRESPRASDRDPITVLFPNPFSTLLVVVVQALPRHIVEIALVDMLGRTVQPGSVSEIWNHSSRTYQIQAPSLPPGVYVLVVRIDDARYGRSIVKIAE